MSEAEATSVLSTFAAERFAVMGEEGFGALNSVFPASKSPKELEQVRAYLLQFRQELASRLARTVCQEDGKVNKWWLSFRKRKFMNKSLGG